MSKQRSIGWAILVVTALIALVPLVRGTVDLPTAQHHLLHAGLLAGAMIAALLVAPPSRDTSAGHYGWLLLAIFSPLLAMMLMWPSEYAWFEHHPGGHILEHLGLVVLGFLTAFAGQRYAAGVGVATALSLFFMALASAWGFGVAPASTVSVASDASAAVTTSAASSSPDAVHGATLFSQNCAVCHGVKGAGGEGPALKDERTRKNLHQAEAWIENPAPPMPKLYPSPLSTNDVRDIAAYIETL